MYVKFFKLFQCKIMYYSLQERKKREYLIFKKEYMRLKKLEKLDLKAEYINTKSKYEYRKNILILCFIMIFPIFLVVFKEYFSFLKLVMNFIFINQGDDIQIAKVGLVLSTIIISFITLVLVSILIIFIKETNSIHKNLLMIEEVRKG